MYDWSCNNFFIHRTQETLARNYSQCGIPLVIFQRRFARKWLIPDSSAQLVALFRNYDLAVVSVAFDGEGASPPRRLPSDVQQHVLDFLSPRQMIAGHQKGQMKLWVSPCGAMNVIMGFVVDEEGNRLANKEHPDDWRYDEHGNEYMINKAFYPDSFPVKQQIEEVEAACSKELVAKVLRIPLVNTSKPHTLVVQVNGDDDWDHTGECLGYLIVPSHGNVEMLSRLVLNKNFWGTWYDTDESDDSDDDDGYGYLDSAGWAELCLSREADEAYDGTLPLTIKYRKFQNFACLDSADENSDGEFYNSGWGGSDSRWTVARRRKIKAAFQDLAITGKHNMRAYGSRQLLVDSLKQQGVLVDRENFTYSPTEPVRDIATPCAIVDVLPSMKESCLASAIPMSDHSYSHDAVVTAQMSFRKLRGRTRLTVVATAPLLPDDMYPMVASEHLSGISAAWGQAWDLGRDSGEHVEC